MPHGTFHIGAPLELNGTALIGGGKHVATLATLPSSPIGAGGALVMTTAAPGVVLSDLVLETYSPMVALAVLVRVERTKGELF